MILDRTPHSLNPSIEQWLERLLEMGSIQIGADAISAGEDGGAPWCRTRDGRGPGLRQEHSSSWKY